jgi:hypothetical protein
VKPGFHKTMWKPLSEGGRMRTSKGQVLPAAVVLLLGISAVFYWMVNSGQILSERIRLTNAADAAAYSAGVVEARALNYHAYINRAMVANEIAIAQALSVVSWVKYFGHAAETYPGHSPLIHTMLVRPGTLAKLAALDIGFIGTDLLAIYGGSSPSEVADRLADGLGVVISAHEIAVTALSISQSAVQVNLAAGVRQQQIARDIAKAMDRDIAVEVMLASHGFDAFTKRYEKHADGTDERGRFAAVTMASRDRFTRERNWTIDSPDIPILRKDAALKKRGGTELVGFDEWRAVDTLELHGRSFGCGFFGTSWCRDMRQPIGWGAAQVNAGGGDAGAGFHGNAYGENSNTAYNMADPDMVFPATAVFRGLPASTELARLDAEAVTAITVHTSKKHSATLTSGNAAKAKPSGRLELFDDRPAGAQLAALSRAQVYFDRIAARADAKEEVGSLYNPYWRVRLVSPTVSDKADAALKQAGLTLK